MFYFLLSSQETLVLIIPLLYKRRNEVSRDGRIISPGARSLGQTDLGLNLGFNLAVEYMALHDTLYFLKVTCSLLFASQRCCCREQRAVVAAVGVGL